jgi:SET domain-containing protein
MSLLLPTNYMFFRGSPIHGIGAFAQTRIPKGTRVIEYVGEVITKQESLRRCERNNEYIFSLDEERDIDGNVPWNPARFINHSCAPNCEALLEEGRIWIVATRDLLAGEEFTFNYGFDLEDYRNYPCLCGSPNCVGYIVAEEFFEHVRKQRALHEFHELARISEANLTSSSRLLNLSRV